MTKSYGLHHPVDPNGPPGLPLSRGDRRHLAPLPGKFIVHERSQSALEGQWPGDLVVIEVPDTCAAAHWNNSAKYPGTAHLRIRKTSSTLIAIGGGKRPHRAADIGAKPPTARCPPPAGYSPAFRSEYWRKNRDHRS
jgi:uncharacterized protein (DUF1330 family)